MAAKWEGKSLVGGRLGQFEVKEEIARGGMGVVYKGYQPSLDRWVAIKTLPIDLAGDRDLVARFQREAEAMVRLNHANIVQIIDRGEDTGQYYFAMEFVEGPSVKDLLKTDTIDTDKIFDMLCQTCDGLDYAHKKGLVHRDIKPANLLYEEKTQTVKIADFGIAHFSKKDEDMLTLTADNVGMGTMNYMSPEQKVNAKDVDHRSDIYALGVIIYEAFTGKLPLGKFKLPSEVNPKLPRQLDTIVAKCLEAEPGERFDSCATLKNMLLEAKASTHDKTLKRSMRDAIDRTLTAVSPKGNKAVGCVLLAFIFFVVFGGLGVGALLLLKGRSTRLRVDSAVASMMKAKARATKLGANHEAGQSTFADAEQLVRNSEPLSGENKAQTLEAAKAKFDAAASAWIDFKRSEVNGVAKRVEDLRQKPKPPVDGIAKAVQAKLDTAEAAARAARDALAKAEQPDGDLVGFDLGAPARAADEVNALLDGADKLSQFRDKLKQAANRDTDDWKAAQAKVDALESALAGGNPGLAQAALDAASSTVSAATNTPKIDTTPRPATSPSPMAIDPSSDPAAVERRATASRAAEEAFATAKRVIDLTRPETTAGTAELDEAKKAHAEAPGQKTPLDQAVKFEAATSSFQKAVDAALKGLEQRRDEVRASASNAKSQARYAEAEAIDGELQGENEPLPRARLLVKQIAGFKAAAAMAQTAGKAAAQEQATRTELAKKNARARLGPGSDALLEKAEVIRVAAQKELDANQLKPASDDFEAAAREFGKAHWPTPASITFPADLKKGFVLAKNLPGFEDGAVDSIAGCPKGFVVSCKDTLGCFDLGFNEVARSVTMPHDPSQKMNPIAALCAGDGDDVFVATFNPATILRFSTANGSIEQQAPLPGDLGTAHRDAILALAYDPSSGLLFSASTTATVYIYSVATGKIQGAPISLKDSRITIPRSIAVAADGTFVVAGDIDRDRPPAESKWRYGAAHYTATGELADVYNTGPAPSAVAAAGDGLIAVDHVDNGNIWIWPKPSSIASAPDPGLMLDDKRPLAHPKYATKLAVYGRHAFVLEQPFEADPDTSFSPWRKRVKIYELKN